MAGDDRTTLERLVGRARNDPEGVPVEPILAALDHRDDATRQRATRALYEISKSRPQRVLDAVPKLTRLFESDRPTLRNMAVMTMVNAGTARPDVLVPFVDEFTALLDDDSASVHRSAIRALRLVATEDASAAVAIVPRLIPSLTSELASTRLDAVTVLELIATDRPDAVTCAIDSLFDVLADRDELSPTFAYDPEVAPQDRRPTDQLRGYRSLAADASDRSAVRRARETAARTVTILAADDPATAAEVLEPHFPRLFDLLDDGSPVVRGATVGILAYVAEVRPAAVRPAEDDLLDLLQAPIETSGNAVWALRFVGSDRAREALEDLAANEAAEDDLRATAEAALADLDS